MASTPERIAPGARPVSAPNRKILEQLIAASAEPLVLARVDQADWPVVMSNPAFTAFAGREHMISVPFTDVVEQLHGRDAAREVSETVRSGQESSIPLEFGGRNLLLVLKPLAGDGVNASRYYGAWWRDAATVSGEASIAHQALQRARRRIRDLSREDALTGLLNEAAFRDVLEHDWAVAARENGMLALLAFRIDEFAAYTRVFGRHASDSCLRRVAQAVRRSLRRASDVAARLRHDDRDVLAVLFHADDQEAVREFAAQIVKEVRELRLHHPHSTQGRYVTVTSQAVLASAKGGAPEAQKFLKDVLAR